MLTMHSQKSSGADDAFADQDTPSKRIVGGVQAEFWKGLRRDTLG